VKKFTNIAKQKTATSRGIENQTSEIMPFFADFTPYFVLFCGSLNPNSEQIHFPGIFGPVKVAAPSMLI